MTNHIGAPPRRGPGTPPTVDTVALSRCTRQVLEVWVAEPRARLVGDLQGSDHGCLWVAVAAGHN